MQKITTLKKLKGYPTLGVFQILIDKATRGRVQIKRFYLLEFKGPPAFTMIRGPGRVREGSPPDVDDMEDLEKGIKQETFLRRFSAGERCVVAVHRDRIVGYEWYTDRSSHIEQRYLFPIQIPADAVYVFDAFIEPEYRISGIWIKFKSYISERMSELGKSRIITLIDESNGLSINTHIRFGFSPFRRIFLLKIGGKNYFWDRQADQTDSIGPIRSGR